MLIEPGSTGDHHMLTMLAILGAYLVGSLPAARLVEAWWSVDLRAVGSRNAGAGNATRSVGLAAGLTLAVLDGLKGLLTVLVASALGLEPLAVALVGLMAVIGNNWPVLRTDRGGRGLATSVGVIVGFAPMLVLWPGVWALIGWKIGGGLAGFLGWGFLPMYVAAADPRPATLLLAAGLGVLMAVRRAQGNAGFETGRMLNRIVWDRDGRDATAPWRPLALGSGPALWVPALLVVGFPTYLWVAGSRAAGASVGRWTVVLLLAAVLTELGAKYTFGELFRDGVLRSGAPLSRVGAFRASLIGTGVARLIPVGGAVTPVAMAWSVGDESEGTVGAALRATVLSYGGLSFAAGAGLVWVSLVHAPVHGARAAFTTGVALTALGVVLVGSAARLRRVLRFVPFRFRDRLGRSLVDHRLTPRSWALLSGRVVLEAATLGLTLLAFDIVMAPSQVIAAFGIAQIVGGLPGTPGGLGVTEAGLLGVLALFGIPAAVTATPVLAFRVISYWLPAIGGVAAGGHAYLRRRTS
jgi:acyl phosphate:glycerol-3-phosphate acyltransferase